MARRTKILRARELRKKSTKAEETLWPYLRDRKFLGKKFRRQHPFEGFILDFYCPGEKLAIELDGAIHFRRKQKEYDCFRQKIIENHGVRVLRFRNHEIFQDIKKVLKTIKKHLNLPSPNGDGEGRLEKNKAKDGQGEAGRAGLRSAG